MPNLTQIMVIRSIRNGLNGLLLQSVLRHVLNVVSATWMKISKSQGKLDIWIQKGFCYVFQVFFFNCLLYTALKSPIHRPSSYVLVTAAIVTQFLTAQQLINLKRWKCLFSCHFSSEWLNLLLWVLTMVNHTQLKISISLMQRKSQHETEKWDCM